MNGEVLCQRDEARDIAEVVFDLELLLQVLHFFALFNDASALIFSLNMLKRRRELLRLTLENQAMLRRLIAKKPNYHHKEWDEAWRVSHARDTVLLFSFKHDTRRLLYLTKDDGYSC